VTNTPVQPRSDLALVSAIKEKAHDLGFDIVGVAPASPSRYGDYFRAWLDAGRHGAMHYLARRVDERTDPAAYLPGAASVICVAMNYYAELEALPGDAKPDHARVARYALGDDYHELIKHRLYALADWLREQVPGARTRCGVDTVPVLERELAARAGIGWVGKNTCVIHPRIGSWLLLGEVLTTIPLPADQPVTDHCGTCTRCIDACPTGAITEPYKLDATRCISYLTIENPGEIPAELHPQIGDWLYGCDVCQDVCPHNTHARPATDPALKPRFATGTLNVNDVLGWADDQYHATLRGTAMKRVKLPVLKRNASIVRENLNRLPSSPAAALQTAPVSDSSPAA
jgi:epoxyqueuosine reductase